MLEETKAIMASMKKRLFNDINTKVKNRVLSPSGIQTDIISQNSRAVSDLMKPNMAEVTPNLLEMMRNMMEDVT